jgi:histidine ammonia-lyase
MTEQLQLDGRSLTLEQIVRVARSGAVELTLGRAARKRVEEARSFLERLQSAGGSIYGVNTGFGRLAEVTIPAEQTGQLQLNLVRSHASGVGECMPVECVRAIALLRANALARGNSGCRIRIVEGLIDHLNHGVHPAIPWFGSVGASGDLAPLAHLALALIGEGRVLGPDEPTSTLPVLERLGIAPVRLRAKEGLALINGTQATTGVGALALWDALRCVEVAEVAGAMSLEALRGTPDAFHEDIQLARPHPGQIESAERLRGLLAGSEIRESHRHGDPRVQDAYCLRCMPQVHGAARDALAYVRRVVEIEANSATDNPLVFPTIDLVVSGGNFHAQIVAQALDFLAVAVADLGSISERRVARLLDPEQSELPAFLAHKPGLESGLMIAQVTVADLLSELRVLAHPASVDSVPTSAGREDHVSMGLSAARKARRAVECLEYVLAVELMCAAEALEHRSPLAPGRGVARAHGMVRSRVPRGTGDRSLQPDIEAVRELIRSDRLGKAGHDVSKEEDR